MRRLTGLDASFLYLETPNNHMHVAGVYVFDPSDVPGGYSFDRCKAVIANRLHRLPPFRWRLVEVPFGLHHPIWVEDPDFDLDYHVRRAALPAPGGRAELAAFAADIAGRQLDRRRPLWEIHIVEGLENGYVAMVSKTHHAAIDGASGAELSANLLDLGPEPVIYEEPQWLPERIPSDTEMVVYALNSLTKQPAQLVRTVKDTIETAVTMRNRPKVEGVTPPPAPFSAPRTSINGPITPHRAFAMTEVSLADIKTIRAAFGGTVNDVVLALCTGALRRYLIDRSELPMDPLVAMVPMSVRAEDQKGAMGNRVTNMFVALPTQLAASSERLRNIQDATKAAKDQATAIGAETLSNWAEFAAPAVAARAARLYASMKLADRHRPLMNVTISNVPGPQFPLYSVGARLVSWYPMGPIFDGSGLNMTVMSYLGVVYFGLLACKETVPDVDGLAAYVRAAADELLDEAQGDATVASTEKSLPKSPGRRRSGAPTVAGAKAASAKAASAKAAKPGTGRRAPTRPKSG
jgi:diacylglycerol O-acyltransferase / wax synthase